MWPRCPRLDGAHVPINSSRTLQACPTRVGRAPNLKSQSLLALALAGDIDSEPPERAPGKFRFEATPPDGEL